MTKGSWVLILSMCEMLNAAVLITSFLQITPKKKENFWAEIERASDWYLKTADTWKISEITQFSKSVFLMKLLHSVLPVYDSLRHPYRFCLAADPRSASTCLGLGWL